MEPGLDPCKPSPIARILPRRPVPCAPLARCPGPSMAIDTIDRFLAVIRRLRLLAPEQLDQVATDLGPHYDEPLPLAQFLVQSEWLTDYQCDALFDGRWDELTLGPYQILARLGEGGVSDV